MRKKGYYAEESLSKKLLTSSSITIPTEKLVSILEDSDVDRVRIVSHGLKMDLEEFKKLAFHLWFVKDPTNRIDVAFNDKESNIIELFNIDSSDLKGYLTKFRGVTYFSCFEEKQGTLMFYDINKHKYKIYNRFIHNLKSKISDLMAGVQ